MIHYKRGPLSFFALVFRMRGSVIPTSLPLVLLSTVLCFLLSWFGVVGEHSKATMGIMLHPSPFAFYLQVTSLILAFHTNSAYQRFWEARSQLQAMASYWADAVSHLVSFDEVKLLQTIPKTTTTPYATRSPSSFSQMMVECINFKAKILHTFSLLHAVCIQYLLNKDGRGCRLEILGGLSRDEAHELDKASDHTYLVQHWINQSISRRMVVEEGLPVGGPVLSRTWQLLYLGMLSYNQTCKIEDTPFPFPYIQLIYLLDFFVAVVAPVVIGIWVPNLVFALSLNFIVVFFIHSLFQAAYLMESPFGQKANDLPLLELHSDFLNRLKMLVDLQTAEALATMVMQSDELAADQVVDVVKEFASWPANVSQSPPVLLTHSQPDYNAQGDKNNSNQKNNNSAAAAAAGNSEEIVIVPADNNRFSSSSSSLPSSPHLESKGSYDSLRRGRLSGHHRRMKSLRSAGTIIPLMARLVTSKKSLVTTDLPIDQEEPFSEKVIDRQEFNKELFRSYTLEDHGKINDYNYRPTILSSEAVGLPVKALRRVGTSLKPKAKEIIKKKDDLISLNE